MTTCTCPADGSRLCARCQHYLALAHGHQTRLDAHAVLPAVVTEATQTKPWYPYRSKTEYHYAALLDTWLDHGMLVRWRYEALRLTLAPRTTLLVDFYLIMDPEVTHDPRPQLHEVKGFLREDAWVKLKTAAKLYPEFRFFLVKRDKKHGTRQWHWEEMPSG